MPWYAVLKNLPSGYDNSIQKVWYVGKTYRVSSYNRDTTAVHTPHHETIKEWHITKAMARRLFDEPYYEAELELPETTNFSPTLQPYQLQMLDALKNFKQEEFDTLIEHRQQITDIKPDMDNLRTGGWSYDNI